MIDERLARRVLRDALREYWTPALLIVVLNKLERGEVVGR